MDGVESRVSNRIELRVIHSLTATLDAWMTVTNDGHTLSFPVHTQLGMPITVAAGGDTVTLREGRLFIHDGGRASRSTKPALKPTYGLVQYLAGTQVEAEAQDQFHVRLYVPTERYSVIWDLSARGHLPRLISLQVKGLQENAQWDVSEFGNMLLVEDFSISFPVSRTD